MTIPPVRHRLARRDALALLAASAASAAFGLPKGVRARSDEQDETPLSELGVRVAALSADSPFAEKFATAWTAEKNTTFRLDAPESRDGLGAARFFADLKPSDDSDDSDPSASEIVLLEARGDVLAAAAAGVWTPSPLETWIPACAMRLESPTLHIRADEERFADWESFLAWTRNAPEPPVVIESAARRADAGGGLVLRLVAKRRDAPLTFRALADPAERYAAVLRGGRAVALIAHPSEIVAYVDGGLLKPLVRLGDPEPKDDAPSLKDLGVDAAAPRRIRGFYAHDNLSPTRRRDIRRRAYELIAEPQFVADAENLFGPVTPVVPDKLDELFAQILNEWRVLLAEINDAQKR